MTNANPSPKPAQRGRPAKTSTIREARAHLSVAHPPPVGTESDVVISIPVWARKPPVPSKPGDPSAVIEVVRRLGPTELRFEVIARHGVPGVPSVAPLSLRSTLAHARGPRQAVAVLLAEVAEYYHNEGAGDCGPAVSEAMLERFAGQV